MLNIFNNCSGLKHIIIPNSVTTIQRFAFYGCSGLTSITIPNSVNSIGGWPFSHCQSLVSMNVEPDNSCFDSREDCNAIINTSTNELVAGCVNTIIPNSVTSIGIGAFSGLSNLSSITIPNSVTIIRGDAFTFCWGLTSIDIPNSVTFIGSQAFACCSGLTSITIPNSVAFIDKWVFQGCSGLQSIAVESGNQYYDSRENCNAIIKTATNELISGCKNTVIPNTVAAIGEHAFYDCGDLLSITIPNSVICIGDWAFGNCRSLSSINSYIKEPFEISESVFSTSQPTILYVPFMSKNKYLATPGWDVFTNILEMKGDLGAKGYTDVSDVVAAINHVIGEKMLGGDSADILDVNDDGQIDVGDIILLIKAILAQGNHVDLPAAARGASDGADLERFTAMQLNVVIPSGTTIRDIKLAGRNRNTHQLMYQQTDVDTYTVVVCSMTNQTFNSVSDGLLEMVIDGDGDPTTDNVLLVAPSGERMAISSLPTKTMTGIRAISAEDIATDCVYDMRGNKILPEGVSFQRLPKGVYIMNGKKIVK